jgi:outer membrane protein assembly factor BamA
LLAAAADGQSAAERDFDLPGEDLGSIVGNFGPALDDADFVGTPKAGFMEKWPNDLVIAPVPGYSPQVGWSVALASGFFLDMGTEDGETPPSLLGGFYWRSANGSTAYGAGGNFHLFDDNLRVKFGAGSADVRYRLYGFGPDFGDLNVSFEVEQEGPMYVASGSWRVWRKLYVGLGLLDSTITTKPRISFDGPLPFFDPTLKLDLGALIVPLEWDTRDHEQFPTSGWKINGRAMFYRDSYGSDFEAETYMVAANHYRPLGDGNVLALRAYARAVSGNPPFFLLSTFGGSKDIRGYPGGRYRAQKMYALQAEYRWQFSDSLIFTGFGGFGEVADNVSDFGKDFLPAVGVGARYVVSQKHRVSLSFDYAVGDGENEFYFGIGEAF